MVYAAPKTRKTTTVPASPYLGSPTSAAATSARAAMPTNFGGSAPAPSLTAAPTPVAPTAIPAPDFTQWLSSGPRSRLSSEGKKQEFIKQEFNTKAAEIGAKYGVPPASPLERGPKGDQLTALDREYPSDPWNEEYQRKYKAIKNGPEDDYVSGRLSPAEEAARNANPQYKAEIDALKKDQARQYKLNVGDFGQERIVADAKDWIKKVTDQAVASGVPLEEAEKMAAGRFAAEVKPGLDAALAQEAGESVKENKKSAGSHRKQSIMKQIAMTTFTTLAGMAAIGMVTGTATALTPAESQALQGGSTPFSGGPSAAAGNSGFMGSAPTGSFAPPPPAPAPAPAPVGLPGAAQVAPGGPMGPPKPTAPTSGEFAGNGQPNLVNAPPAQAPTGPIGPTQTGAPMGGGNPTAGYPVGTPNISQAGTVGPGGILPTSVTSPGLPMTQIGGGMPGEPSGFATDPVTGASSEGPISSAGLPGATPTPSPAATTPPPASLPGATPVATTPSIYDQFIGGLKDFGGTLGAGFKAASESGLLQAGIPAVMEYLNQEQAAKATEKANQQYVDSLGVSNAARSGIIQQQQGSDLYGQIQRDTASLPGMDQSLLDRSRQEALSSGVDTSLDPYLKEQLITDQLRDYQTGVNRDTQERAFQDAERQTKDYYARLGLQGSGAEQTAIRKLNEARAAQASETMRTGALQQALTNRSAGMEKGQAQIGLNLSGRNQNLQALGQGVDTSNANAGTARANVATKSGVFGQNVNTALAGAPQPLLGGPLPGVPDANLGLGAAGGILNVGANAYGNYTAQEAARKKQEQDQANNQALIQAMSGGK